MNIVQSRDIQCRDVAKVLQSRSQYRCVAKKVVEDVDVDGCDAWRVAQLLWRDFRLGRLGCMAGSHCISLEGVSEEKCGLTRFRHCMGVIVSSSHRCRRRKVLVSVCLCKQKPVSTQIPQLEM